MKYSPTFEIVVIVLVTVNVFTGIVVRTVAATVDVNTLTELIVAVVTGRKQSQALDTALYARDRSGFGAPGYLRRSESGSSFDTAVVDAFAFEVDVILLTTAVVVAAVLCSSPRALFAAFAAAVLGGPTYTGI